MRQKIISVVLLSVLCKVHATTLPKRIHINDRSEVRSVCHIEFPTVTGLTVEAKLVSANAGRRIAGGTVKIGRNITAGIPEQSSDFFLSFAPESLGQNRNHRLE